MRIRSILCVASLIVLGLLDVARAATCTKGVDCYCDKVQGGSLNDPQLLFCEDFEAPTLRLNQGVGDGAPYYGPPYDPTGGASANDRGANGYFVRVYGTPGFTDQGHWANGQPASPVLGPTCGHALCNGVKIWVAGDQWQGNAFNPLISIMRQASDFTAEIGSLTVPTNASGGGSGVFDGNASFAHRVIAGETAGIMGGPTWAAVTQIGYTAAIAYSSNLLASGIIGPSNGSNPAAWKHNEWVTVAAPNCGFEGPFNFYNQNDPFPFAGFIGTFGSACTGLTYTGSLTVNVGAAQIAAGSGILWQADQTLYQQSRDWPLATWGCVRGWIRGLGTANARNQVWFMPSAGPNAGVEVLIADFQFNGTDSALDNRQGYSGMLWNAYANTNQGGGYTPSTSTAFRYEDNTHVRNGSPVSCAQIGFGTSGGSSGQKTWRLRLRR